MREARAGAHVCTSTSDVRYDLGALCGGVSLLLPAPERLSGCCTPLRAPSRRLLCGHPQRTPSSSPQEGGDLKEPGVTRAFARASPPPSFPAPRTGRPPGPRPAAPATFRRPLSQRRRLSFPAPGDWGRFLFRSCLGNLWPLFCPLSWAGLPQQS